MLIKKLVIFLLIDVCLSVIFDKFEKLGLITFPNSETLNHTNNFLYHHILLNS